MRENRAGRTGLEYFDHCHFVASEIYWRLLVLYFNAGSPKPSVVCARWAKILLCADNTKYRFGFPWGQSKFAGVLFGQRVNAQYNSAEVDKGRGTHRTFLR